MQSSPKRPHRQQLEGEERTEQLARIPTWTRPEGDRDCIFKRFQFDNFDTAFFRFMTAVGREAERVDHHPEWFNVYNRVEVTLATHTANGVTRKDVDMAAFMDELAATLTAAKAEK